VAEEWYLDAKGDWMKGAPPAPSPDDDSGPAPDDDSSPEPSGNDEWIRLDAGSTSQSCDPGCEITSAEECQRAIDYINKKIGRKSTSANNVKSVSYSFYPPNCFTSCFSDYSGHFCPYFNTHNPGKETYTSKDQWKFCKGTCGPQSMKVATDYVPDPVQEATEKSAAEEELAAMRAAEEAAHETAVL
jgi:hypothetical protein